MNKKIFHIILFLFIFVSPGRSAEIFSDTFDWSGNFADNGYLYASASWEKLSSGGYGDDGGCARVQGGHPLEIDISSSNVLEIYIRFYCRMVDSSAGVKWLKIFGETSGSTYANTTFGQQYTTGEFQAVSYGSIGCNSCDTQATTNYPGGNWVAGSTWTYYEAHIKFADNSPYYDNGVIEVWYGDEVKLSVSGVENRNANHVGLDISRISLSDYATESDSAVGYMYIDNLVIDTVRVGQDGGQEPSVNFNGPINWSQ